MYSRFGRLPIDGVCTRFSIALEPSVSRRGGLDTACGAVAARAVGAVSDAIDAPRRSRVRVRSGWLGVLRDLLSLAAAGHPLRLGLLRLGYVQREATVGSVGPTLF